MSLGWILPAFTPHLAGTVTLSGESVIAINTGATAWAKLRIAQDGKVYTEENLGGFVQVDTLDDWVRPITSAPTAYQVRYTGLSGDPLFTSPTEDVWHELKDSDFTLNQRDTIVDGSGLATTVTIEIRYGPSGAVLDSAIYDLSAERTS